MPYFDYYELLEVDKQCSQAVIERAYRELAKRYHPDNGGNTRIMQMLNEAYAVLTDPIQRRGYDSSGVAQSRVPVSTRVSPLPTNMEFDMSGRVFGNRGLERMRPGDAVGVLYGNVMYGTASRPVSVHYETLDLQRVAFDIQHFFFAAPSFATDEGAIWMRQCLDFVLAHGIGAAHDLLHLTQTNLVVSPTTVLEIRPHLLVWFRSGGQPSFVRTDRIWTAHCAVAWLQTLAVRLPKDNHHVLDGLLRQHYRR